MNRRNFLFGLGGLAAFSATPAYAQVWRRVCVSTGTNPDICSGNIATGWKQICTSDGNCAVRGYFGGGYNGSSYVAAIDGIDFSTEAAINPAATLADGGRERVAGVQSGGIL